MKREDAGGGKRSGAAQDKKRQRKEGGARVGGEGGVKREESKDGKPGRTGVGGVKKDSSTGAVQNSAASASAPLFPKWFLQLPVTWQVSVSRVFVRACPSSVHVIIHVIRALITCT